jgi:hypothetical protein
VRATSAARRSPIPRGLSIGPSLTFARAGAPVLDVGGGWWSAKGLVVSALPGHRRLGEMPHRHQIKTHRSGMQVHVLTAHGTDAGRTVDRRGRRACLLKSLLHEEIAPRCLRRRPARWRSGPPSPAGLMRRGSSLGGLSNSKVAKELFASASSAKVHHLPAIQSLA